MKTDSPAGRPTRRKALRLLSSAAGLACSYSAWQNEVDPVLASAQIPSVGSATASFERGAIIRTVLKDIPPETLAGGSTLFHEHLSMSRPFPYIRPLPEPPPAAHFTADVARVVAEVRAAGKDGVVCIVDGGHADMGRSMDALRRVARESGVHVVASGGYYVDRAYPPEVRAKSEDQIAEDLVREATAERFGAFGEIGTSNEITLTERTIFRAIGKAHSRTGIPIFTHNAIYKPDDHDNALKVAMLQLDIFESIGVDPRRVVVGHLCCHDDVKAAVPIAVAKRGAFIGFDRTEVNFILPDAARVRMAVAIIEAGHADRLLLSSDYDSEMDLKANGGPGFARTVTVFGPMLKRAGVDDATLRRILIDNPRRFLAFVPKRVS